MSGKYRVWESEVPQVKEWKLDNKQWPYQTLGRASNLIAQHITLTIRNNMTSTPLSSAHSVLWTSNFDWKSGSALRALLSLLRGHLATSLWSCHIIWFAWSFVTSQRQDLSGFFTNQIFRAEWNVRSMPQKRRDNEMIITSLITVICTWHGNCWTDRAFTDNYRDDRLTTSYKLWVVQVEHAKHLLKRLKIVHNSLQQQ